MIRSTVSLLALAALVSLAGCGGAANEQTAAPARAELSEAEIRGAVETALADPSRDAQRPADERRKPLDLVVFSGVQPGDKVLDLIPGSGYWTRIFAKVVGPQGHVYAVWPEAYARFARGNVTDLEALSRTPEFANVTVAVQESNLLTAPEKLDLVWTSQNYHDYPAEFMGETDPSVLNRAVFEMLKPGGTYVIIDHAAAPGAGMGDVEAMHRIDPATVRAQVVAAGFDYVGESTVLANPDDPRDVAVFDPSVRGRTDQFAFRFRKPE